MRELPGWHLDHLGPVPARQLCRAVGRAGVGHEQLDAAVEPLGSQCLEHFPEQTRPR